MLPEMLPVILAPLMFESKLPDPEKKLATARLPRLALPVNRLPLAASMVTLPTVNPFLTTKLLVLIFYVSYF